MMSWMQLSYAVVVVIDTPSLIEDVSSTAGTPELVIRGLDLSLTDQVCREENGTLERGPDKGTPSHPDHPSILPRPLRPTARSRLRHRHA